MTLNHLLVLPRGGRKHDDRLSLGRGTYTYSDVGGSSLPRGWGSLVEDSLSQVETQTGLSLILLGLPVTCGLLDTEESSLGAATVEDPVQAAKVGVELG